MKNSKSRWIKLMGIGAFCVMLLSIGVGPAAALDPGQPCIDCDPGDGDPPPPPPPHMCQYDDQTLTSVPLTGLGPELDIKRATEKTTYPGWCSIACPDASYSWQGPLGSYCDCYNDTIPQLRAAGIGNWEIHRTRYAIWSEPAVADTKTLLVALAGQNGFSGGSRGGGPGNTTGQPNRWIDACDDVNCKSQTFSSASFVGR